MNRGEEERKPETGRGETEREREAGWLTSRVITGKSRGICQLPAGDSSTQPEGCCPAQLLSGLVCFVWVCVSVCTAWMLRSSINVLKHRARTICRNQLH